jgi:hypothetical protein
LSGGGEIQCRFALAHLPLIVGAALPLASDKAQRDALNNQRFTDTYIHASQEPWIQFYPGIGL